MPGFQKFFYGLSRAFFDAEMQRLYKIAMIYIKGMELRQLLVSSQLAEKATYIAELNRILVPYAQASKFLKIEESTISEINAENYLGEVDNYLKHAVIEYLAALSVKEPAPTDTVLHLTEKMVDFINAHSFFAIFDLCRQAGEKSKELDSCIKKITAALEKSAGATLAKKRLHLSDIDLLTIAVVNYQNFCAMSKEVSGKLEDPAVQSELARHELECLTETAKVMNTIGRQLSICLNSLITVGEKIVKGSNDILSSLISEKNALGKEIAELNKQIQKWSTDVDEAERASVDKLETMQLLRDQKLLAYESLVHQAQVVAVKLMEEHLASRAELKELTDTIKNLSVKLHDINKTQFLPYHRSCYIVSNEDTNLLGATKVRILKEKFEALGAQQPAAVKPSSTRSLPILGNGPDKNFVRSPRNAAVTEAPSSPVTSPRASPAVPPRLPRTSSASKAIAITAKSPRGFFGSSPSTESSIPAHSVAGATPPRPPALISELEQVMKRRPSSPALMRKGN